MGYRKSKHNPCPICELPRGKGPYEYAHGKCVEINAKKLDEYEATTLAGDAASFDRLTIKHKKHGVDNTAKKSYKLGKLPKWMFS